MINVVDHASTIADAYQSLQNLYNIDSIKHSASDNFLSTKTAIEFHTANSGQIITVGGKEQILKEIFSRLLRWRLSWAHHAVNLNQSFQLISGRVLTQSV